MRLKLKVVPGAAQEKVAGWLGDTLKVRVQAPPEKGKANTAVQKLLAKTLSVPKQNVQIISGHTSAHKTVEIAQLDETELNRRLPK